MKFGGTSVGLPQRMHQVAKLIGREPGKKIVVLSAVAGTTNALVEISEEIKQGNVAQADSLVRLLEHKYEDFIKQLLSDKSQLKKAQAFIKAKFDELSAYTHESFDALLEKKILAQGELISTQLFTLYCEEQKISAVLLPALDFMLTDKDNEPVMHYTERKLKESVSRYPDITYFITQGYICRNHMGEVDNLQRGGSDYTAGIVGAAIRASEIHIWTDIDGMHNNDPRVVDKTRPISNLSFDEAAELAYFGAKILHPLSIRPAQNYDIPVRLLNTMQPEAKGTLISANQEPGSVKAIAAKDGITAIKIKSGRMLLAYGFLRKVFEIFEKYKTPIDMITTSEVAVSLTIDKTDYIELIMKDLAELGHVEQESGQTIICIVGDLVADSKGVLMQVFDSLAEVPIRMVSYGGSKNNISLLVKSEYKKEVLSSLNKGLFQL
ncbi:MAG: aspartate kinase [Cyclobacteriaceae bacterium]|nr:aspartate kinase [Cyclobacteriaceae bacterium]